MGIFSIAPESAARLAVYCGVAGSGSGSGSGRRKGPNTMGRTTQSAAAAGLSAELRERYRFLRDIVAEMERHVPYAAALASSVEGVRLNLRDAEQNVARRDPRYGVVLTASNGVFLEEEAIGATEVEAVRAAARALVERVRARDTAPRSAGPELRIDPGDPLDADFATPATVEPEGVPLREKLERCEGLRQQARGLDPRIVQAIAVYTDGVETKVFANRAKFATEVLRRVDLYLSLYVTDGHGRRYDWLHRGGTGGLELVDVEQRELEELRDSAVALLAATPVPPGMYDVVADSGVSGVLAHEAFGHGVETDMFLKGRARGAAYLGREVGSPLVTILDDPTVPGGYGSYFIDDEGQPATPTCIIKDGVLQRGLTDLNSAARIGMARSANGRRESFERKAYARMSNTFFAPGTSTRDEVLGSLDHGLLLCRASSGMEDPKGWGIQITAHYAREYRGGRPTGVLYAPVSITGYVPELLQNVCMVADDLELHPGGCGKGWKEYIYVGDGGPHVRTRVRCG